MKKYRTNEYAWRDLIEEVEITRETEKQVVVSVVLNSGKVREDRSAKKSSSVNYFDTWEEAKLYLLERAESKVTHARRELDKANSHLGNIKGLKKP